MKIAVLLTVIGGDRPDRMQAGAGAVTAAGKNRLVSHLTKLAGEIMVAFSVSPLPSIVGSRH